MSREEVVNGLIEKGFLLVVFPPICSSYFLFSGKLEMGAYVDTKGDVLYTIPDITNEMTTAEKQKIIKNKLDILEKKERDRMNQKEKVSYKVHKLITFPFFIIDDGIKISTRFGKVEIGKYIEDNKLPESEKAKITTDSNTKKIIRAGFIRFVNPLEHLEFVKGIKKNIKEDTLVPFKTGVDYAGFYDENKKEMSVAHEILDTEDLQELTLSFLLCKEATEKGTIKNVSKEKQIYLNGSEEECLTINENEEFNIYSSFSSISRKDRKPYSTNLSTYSWVHRASLCIVVSENTVLGNIAKKED